ncbi:hypothetical protein ACF0H5_022703 [Mactra antiquata]
MDNLESEFGLKPRDKLKKIVEEISQSLDLEDMHIELASDERSDDLVEFLATHFFGDEPITKSLGIEIDEMGRNMLKQRYAQNLSLLLICDKTNEVIGCRTIIMKSQTSSVDGVRNSPVDLGQRIMTAMRFLSQKDAEMDIFEYYNVNCFAHFINLGVRNDFRKKGLATKLMGAALQFLKQIGLDNPCIKVECSSRYSQRICEKFGFTLLHSLLYDEYLENGKVAISNTGDDKCCNVYVKQLN